MTLLCHVLEKSISEIFTDIVVLSDLFILSNLLNGFFMFGTQAIYYECMANFS